MEIIVSGAVGGGKGGPIQPGGIIITIRTDCRCSCTVIYAVPQGTVAGDLEGDRYFLLRIRTGAIFFLRNGEGQGDVVRIPADFIFFQRDGGGRYIQIQFFHRSKITQGCFQHVARRVPQGAASICGFQAQDADGLIFFPFGHGHALFRAEIGPSEGGAVPDGVDPIRGIGHFRQVELHRISIFVYIEDGFDIIGLKGGVHIACPKTHFLIQGQGEGQVIPHTGPGGGRSDILRPISIGVRLVALGHIALEIQSGIARGIIVQHQVLFQHLAAGPGEGVACKVGDQAVSGKITHVHGLAAFIQQRQAGFLVYPGLGFHGSDEVVHPAFHIIGEDQLVPGEGNQMGGNGLIGALAGFGAEQIQLEFQIVGYTVGKADRLAHFQSDIRFFTCFVSRAGSLIACTVAYIGPAEGGGGQVGKIHIGLAHLGTAAGAIGAAHGQGQAIFGRSGQGLAAGIGAGHFVRVVLAVLQGQGGFLLSIGSVLYLHPGPVGEGAVAADMHMPISRQRCAHIDGDLF